MKYFVFILSILWTISSYSQNENLLLSTDLEGNITEGSIGKLIQEIQKGSPLRVGWKMDFDKDSIPDIEHWIDAEFISILGGHVFNQIQPIYQQLPVSEIPQIEILESAMLWTGVIGTNGLLKHRFIYDADKSDISDEKVLNMIDRQTRIRERMVWTMWAKK